MIICTGKERQKWLDNLEWAYVTTDWERVPEIRGAKQVWRKIDGKMFVLNEKGFATSNNYLIDIAAGTVKINNAPGSSAVIQTTRSITPKVRSRETPLEPHETIRTDLADDVLGEPFVDPKDEPDYFDRQKFNFAALHR